MGDVSRLQAQRNPASETTPVPEVLGEILDATIALQRADFGSLQVFDRDRRVLRVAVQRGFPPEFVDECSVVEVEDESVFGRALRDGKRIVIEDVETDPEFASLRTAAARGGFRAVQSTPLFGADGEPRGMLSTHFRAPRRLSELDFGLTDAYMQLAAEVLDQEEAREALRRTEARYRTLFESIDDGFCVIEVVFDERGRPVDHRFLETNPAFERHSTLRNAEGRTIRELVPDVDEHWFEAFSEVARTGKPTRFERGSEALGRWFDVFAFRVDEPEDQRVAVLFRDASERRRVERTLRAGAERDAFRLALSDALRPLADPGRIQEEATRLLRDHLRVGRAMYAEIEDDTIIVEADWCREGVPSAVGRYPLNRFGSRLVADLRAGGVAVCADIDELVGLTPEEREAYGTMEIHAFVAVPLVKEGRLTALLSVHETSARGWTEEEVGLVEEVAERTWDAVERARAEASLREAKAAAEQASEAKSRFLAMISHELRTPLSGVIGCARLLEEETLGGLNPEQRDTASRIAANSWHLAGIIQEILTLSRVEAGRETVRREEVDVAAVARDVVGILEPEAKERGLSWRLVGVATPVLARTDPGKVRQILVNLVGNAVKYTHEGRITVRLAGSRTGAVRIHVRDTGPGIDPEDQERIFEPFTQVDSSHSRHESGTGLGLAIAGRLARLLNGDITLRSTPGKGSTFTLHLPP